MSALEPLPHVILPPPHILNTCAVAVAAVNTLTNEGDFATLKPMVSAKLLSILESTVEVRLALCHCLCYQLTGIVWCPMRVCCPSVQDYGSTGMTWHTELDAEEPLQAQLRGVAFWGPKEMAR